MEEIIRAQTSIQSHLGCRVFGFLLTLTTTCSHELPDGDSIFEGWFMYGALNLDQVVFRGEASSYVQLLKQGDWCLG